MFNRDNYDISPEDAQKSIAIRRHTADLAIIDFEAGTPFFWDNEGIAFKRMVSIKTGYYFQHNTIPMIYAAREHGYTDCRWGGILALKGNHLYKQDEGVELEVWANEVSVQKIDENGNPIYDQNGHPVEEMVKLSRPQIKIERLYNGSAISGLGEEPALPYNWMEKNETKKRLLANCKAKIVFDQTENNFYVKDTDTIHMVPEEKWKNKDEFLVELYHCIAHSTLIDSRAGKNPFFLDLKKRCGQTNYSIEELVVEMATYRFRTKYGLKINDGHKKAHSEYLTRWADEIDRNPNILNYTYSDSFAILNYVKDHIVQFTKEEEKAIRYKFNYWRKNNQQKSAVKKYQQRESSKSLPSVTPKTVSKPPKLEKPVEHGTITRFTSAYHPDYGKGRVGEYISENGKPKVEIVIGDGSPGTGSGFYSLNQLKAKYTKWYFGDEAIAKAEEYYNSQKKSNASDGKAKLMEEIKKSKSMINNNQTEKQDSDIVVGQIVKSKSSGKGVISKIYKNENGVDMVNIKYPVMTLSYNLEELRDESRFTLVPSNNASAIKNVDSQNNADTKKDTEKNKIEENINIVLDANKEITSQEEKTSNPKTIETAPREPRKDYHRKLNSQEAIIADTVVKYVRNIPPEKQQEYGKDIQKTSEAFAKKNNIPTPPPIQTAAVKAKRRKLLLDSQNPNKSAERELTREMERK